MRLLATTVACDFLVAGPAYVAEKIITYSHHLLLSLAKALERGLKHVSKSYEIFCVVFCRSLLLVVVTSFLSLQFT